MFLPIQKIKNNKFEIILFYCRTKYLLESLWCRQSENFDLVKVKENLSFPIGQQTSVIQNNKTDDEDDIIVLDSDGNSMLSFPDKKIVAEKPNKLLANKLELSGNLIYFY